MARAGESLRWRYRNVLSLFSGGQRHNGVFPSYQSDKISAQYQKTERRYIGKKNNNNNTDSDPGTRSNEKK